MAYKIIWTDSAIGDLQEICSFISKQNAEAATRVGQELLNHVRILETFPFIGPAYPRRTSGPVREIVCGKYRVFYSVNETGRLIEVLHVWHGARGEPPAMV